MNKSPENGSRRTLYPVRRPASGRQEGFAVSAGVRPERDLAASGLVPASAERARAPRRGVMLRYKEGVSDARCLERLLCVVQWDVILRQNRLFEAAQVMPSSLTIGL